MKNDLLDRLSELCSKSWRGCDYLGAPPQTWGAVLQKRMNLGFIYNQQLRGCGKATGSGKETKLLRCMFSYEINVEFLGDTGWD